MKVKISYFYNIRHFQPNEVPLSTAKYDPKWYKNSWKHGVGWLDHNKVINGLRISLFVPGSTCDGLCEGTKTGKCDPSQSQVFDTSKCKFLKAYREQIFSLDFNRVFSKLEVLEETIQRNFSLKGEEITFVLMVHEKPDNACSEREVLKEWFASNGVELEEWQRV